MGDLRVTDRELLSGYLVNVYEIHLWLWTVLEIGFKNPRENFQLEKLRKWKIADSEGSKISFSDFQLCISRFSKNCWSSFTKDVQYNLSLGKSWIKFLASIYRAFFYQTSFTEFHNSFRKILFFTTNSLLSTNIKTKTSNKVKIMQILFSFLFLKNQMSMLICSTTQNKQ